MNNYRVCARYKATHTDIRWEQPNKDIAFALARSIAMNSNEFTNVYMEITEQTTHIQHFKPPKETPDTSDFPSAHVTWS